VDVRDVLEGRAEPAGQVVVVDDLGFHQATSVAELLADRGCAVEIITAGMVVGQDLGITLDMETFNMRAHAKGIRQATDLVVIGAARWVADGPGRDGQGGADGDGAGGVELSLLHHPTGQPAQRRCDWVVCAVHQAPEDELWQELQAAPFEVHRVGDCVAPRRAHAAVIEGHRVAVAL
jgi:2,4-dienoyl-CoA reductase (NADPH2)